MAIQVGGSKQGGMDEINVTPLIDVVLVLLIIFMVLTPITVQKMANNLPPTDPPEEDQPDPPQDQLMVAVYEDGAISLNLKEGPDADIMKELAQRLRSKAKKTVFLDASPKANYGRVVQVMDMIRGASMVHDSEKGVDITDVHLGLADMKEEGPARLAPGAVLPGSTPAPAAPAVP